MNYRDEILRYIERHGVIDKDAMLQQKAKNEKHPGSRRSRKRIDLHGKTADEAERAFGFAIDRCMETGTKELLVIHGVGRHSDPEHGPVLKSLVRHLLETRFRGCIRGYRPARPADGGAGCTIVKFK